MRPLPKSHPFRILKPSESDVSALSQVSSSTPRLNRTKSVSTKKVGLQIYKIQKKTRPTGPGNSKDPPKTANEDHTNYSHFFPISIRRQAIRFEKIAYQAIVILPLIISIIILLSQFDIWLNNTPAQLISAPDLFSGVPFPAVTICSEAKSIKTDTINISRFSEYLNEFRFTGQVVEKPNWLNDDEYMKMRALLQVCGKYLVEGLTFSDQEPMTVIDHLNEIASSFSDTFVFCAFNRTMGRCMPFFEKIYTEEGICYTFNALDFKEIFRANTYQYERFQMEQEQADGPNEPNDFQWKHESYNPANNQFISPILMGPDPETGLIVALRGKFDNSDNVCRSPIQGFKVFLHSSDEMPQLNKEFIHIPYGRDVLVNVKPEYISTSNNAQYIPFKRNCYLPNERYLRFFRNYTQNNCEIECLANFTLQKCGCVQFSMPRLLDTRVCDVGQIGCYDQAEFDYLLKEFAPPNSNDDVCRCLPGCFGMNYRYEISENIIPPHVHLNLYGTADAWDKVDKNVISRISIIFDWNGFLHKEREEGSSLLSNMTGLLVLFFGTCSLSVMEMAIRFGYRFLMRQKNLKCVSA